MKKTKRSKKSRSWVIKQHRDQFYKKSKVLGYRARSAFKLIELNKKFKFIKNNCTLLDIGASPGGWSQISKEINNKGQIVAIDIKPMETNTFWIGYFSILFKQCGNRKAH